MMGEIN